MSLRARVLTLIGLVLVAGMLVGSVLAGYEAKQALQAELSAGMTGGAQTVRSAFEDLPRSDHPERDLRQLIATFDGNRHVRAVLIGAGGRLLAASRVAGPAHAAPPWFARLLGASPAPIAIAVPASVRGFRAVRLEPTAGLDVGALWTEFSIVLATLCGALIVGLILVYLAIGAALRPLRLLAEGFARIGAGRYGGRVSIQGPSELTHLAAGFNSMGEQLAAMDDRNRMLEGQLLTLQEEERADLARDLHDEIGPHLFAVNVDAEVISQLAAARRTGDIPERVRSIQSGVSHMQRLVREILGRLRPTRVTELGLGAAIDDLTAFWKARRPDVSFSVELVADEAALSEALKDTIYRVIQEAVSNAVRHGEPSLVTISVRAHEPDAISVEVADDGVAQPEPSPVGLGLIGMRERVRASDGTLEIDKGAGGGWRVRARLPARAPVGSTDGEDA
jgi:two-component system sensor histidine kinase UhpB